MRAVIFGAILLLAGLIEVGSWPADAPSTPDTSLSSLAEYTLHGRPAPPESGWNDGLAEAGARTPLQTEHELLPPAHVHAQPQRLLAGWVPSRTAK